jgi:hypothetical protein
MEILQASYELELARGASHIASTMSRLIGKPDVNEVTDAWIINERTSGDWVRIGFRINTQERVGTLSDAALAAVFLAAGDGASEFVINRLLTRAVQNYLRRNPHVSSPTVGYPPDLT